MLLKELYKIETYHIHPAVSRNSNDSIQCPKVYAYYTHVDGLGFTVEVEFQ